VAYWEPFTRERHVGGATNNIGFLKIPMNFAVKNLLVKSTKKITSKKGFIRLDFENL
jgi:hypothetical protein